MRTIALGAASAAPGKAFEFTRVPPGAYRIVAVSQQTYMQELPAGFTIPANPPPGLVIAEIRPGVRAIVGDIPAEEAPPPNANPAGGSAAVMFGEVMVAVGNENVEGISVPVFPGVSAKMVYRPAEGCGAQVNIQMSPTEDWGSGTISRMMEAGMEVALTPPPAPFTLALGGAACFLESTEIDFRQTSSSEAIPLVAAPYASIKGTIGTARLPADAYELALISAGGDTKWLLPDPQANFVFSQLQPGHYRIAVFHAAGDRSTPLAMLEIDAAGGKPTKVEFPPLP
jgi:hypothetical protein